MRVRVIRSQGAAALVEWRDGSGVHRATVPASTLQDDGQNGLLCFALDRGIPYGVPWAEIINFVVTPEAIEQALYERGLWTERDILAAKPTVVLGALQSVYGLDLSALLSAANQMQKRKGVNSNGR